MAKAKENEKTPSQPESVEDGGTGHVPDPLFHGRHFLHVGVNFADSEGGETRVEAGEINGSDLPVDVAHSLHARGHLTKA